EQALELTDTPLLRAQMLEQVGVMAWRSRDGDAESLLRAAIEAFEEQGQSHPAARVSARLAEIESASGELAQAIERMERAFAVLASDEPDADVATLAAQLGRLYLFEGRIEEAMERVELALGIAEALDLPETLSQALNTRSTILGRQG